MQHYGVLPLPLISRPLLPPYALLLIIKSGVHPLQSGIFPVLAASSVGILPVSPAIIALSSALLLASVTPVPLASTSYTPLLSIVAVESTLRIYHQTHSSGRLDLLAFPHQACLAWSLFEPLECVRSV